MDNENSKKRTLTEDEDDPITQYKKITGPLSDEMTAYNIQKWEKMKNKCIVSDPPPAKGLITQCLLWPKTPPKKYPVTSYFGSTNRGAHRISLAIAHGMSDLPKFDNNEEPLEACHKCDVKSCIEPSHLYLGTKEQNADDIIRNGLMRGEKHPSSKITEALAIQIKLSKPLGISQRSEKYESRAKRAVRFGVAESTVAGIDKGDTWAHLKFSDGSTSIAKTQKRRKTRKARRRLLKNTPWTREQFEEANAKIHNPDYVCIRPTRIWFGTPCIEWLGTPEGEYGNISIHGQSLLVHIVACTIGNNYKRPKGLDASHKCGLSSCVEPTHLRFQTKAENMADKIVHGTNKNILSMEQEKQVRIEVEEGNVMKKTIAEKYGVSPSTINYIVKKGQK